MIVNLPNILTVLRLLAAPGVAISFLYFHRPYADWFALILFLSAAITDWFDGYLARAWGQETRLGAMLDPIADKAMVIIALMVIVGYSSYSAWLVLPATVISFREVFVSGLREFLGDKSGTLKVTPLAKWKTTLQMFAIAVIFSQGVFEHFAEARQGIFEGAEVWSGYIGLILLWASAGLTFITGWDYFRKALPYLMDNK